ncbi:H-NS histone family protein [Roseomonas sp. KE2513]|uniref:H-NS histone family protein n=1 Tax=Roseomonas sp. KE2513 TaxID=2479202 RepID=UPI0018E00FC5|nr:H-NS histone family protein [Roseomonas sp. KE2513]MBI0538971.1 H-NS histone family protein [Roseomonas sp. KE2513]
MAKHLPNLDNLSVQDFTQLIQEAEVKRAEKQESAKAALVEEVTAKAAQLGLSLEALLGKQAAPKTNGRKVHGDAGKPLAVKYRGPDDATWTGRGRMPKWLAEAIERGKTKEDFAV